MQVFKSFRKVFLIILAVSVMAPPAFAAKGAAAEDARYASLVIDANTGAVLHQDNAGKTRYPASLTKMMTLYLAFQALESGKLSMNQQLRATAHSAGQKPSIIGIRAGQGISVRDAINAVVIKSANDAAALLAEGVSGTEQKFALQMTRTAKSLGMNHTNFSNASGLPDNRQVTTAYDMARLALALRRDFPQYYPLFSQDSFTYRGQTIYSHNRVTRNYRGADGLKTGYIRASGFNLVTSAKRGNTSLVGVVMGGRSIKSRDTNMIKLLDQGFSKLSKGGATNASYIDTSSVNDNADDSDNNQSDTDDSAEAAPTAASTKTANNSKITKANTKNQAPSETSSAEAFSRNIKISDEVKAALKNTDVANNDDQPFSKGRDIFSPDTAKSSDEENIKPLRVRVNGKRVPVPVLRAKGQESRLVNKSNIEAPGKAPQLFAAQ